MVSPDGQRRMDKSRKPSERSGRNANEEGPRSVFDTPLPGDRPSYTPWELWERRTAQAGWRDFVESSLEDKSLLSHLA